MSRLRVRGGNAENLQTVVVDRRVVPAKDSSGASSARPGGHLPVRPGPQEEAAPPPEINPIRLLLAPHHRLRRDEPGALSREVAPKRSIRPAWSGRDEKIGERAEGRGESPPPHILPQQCSSPLPCFALPSPFFLLFSSPWVSPWEKGQRSGDGLRRPRAALRGGRGRPGSGS
jgi:hypothetical protein